LLSVRHRYSRPIALAAGGALLALFVALKATTPLFAFVLGGAVYFFARRFGRMTAPLLGVVLAVGVLAAPWVPALLPSPEWESRKMEFLSNSAIHRIQIWQTTAGHIQEKFWFGHGFDASRRMYPQGSGVVKIFRQDDPAKTYINPFEPIPLHPHNMILQIWLELGLAGAVLVLAALGSALVSLARATLAKTEKAAGYAFFVTALTIGCVSFGAWQAWWLSTIILNAALMIAVFSRPPASPRA
jgi:O-antigen ligase